MKSGKTKKKLVGRLRCAQCHHENFVVMVSVEGRGLNAGDVAHLDGTEPIIGMQCIGCGLPYGNDWRMA